MRRLPILLCSALLCAQAQSPSSKKPFHPDIPKVWDDAAMVSIELPRAAKVDVVPLSSAYYYSIPERTLWKTYPIYAPGKEPAGYWEWLQQQEPQQAVDFDKLRTEEDWVNAGSIVFDSANTYGPPDKGFMPVRDPGWWKAVNPPTAPDGTIPFEHYVIRKKGRVEVATDACTECHTRVMSDGKVIYGAQGNVPFSQMFAYAIRNIPEKTPAAFFNDVFYAAPWIKPDPSLPLGGGSIKTFRDHLASLPQGVNPRQGTSALYPIQIPDLIGVKDRLYLDRTGLEQNRNIADLMRYDAINNFINEITAYDGFIPSNDPGDTRLPDAKTQTRDSDRALYALAMYLYSLKPPENPNKPSPLTAKGQKIFAREGCPKCHTPPLYTNNMLTPVEGFKVTDEAKVNYRITPVVVGTDPYNALNTRRGTGFYKVPSLKGVWYRGPFGHNGEVATLEDWFDVHRLDENYVRTGYRGYNLKSTAVPGHEYGLDISPEDKKALIAFLKTL